jgi:hypothetical protein
VTCVCFAAGDSDTVDSRLDDAGGSRLLHGLFASQGTVICTLFCLVPFVFGFVCAKRCATNLPALNPFCGHTVRTVSSHYGRAC